jgi:dTDP-glucose 4,6-dehydratase
VSDACAGRDIVIKGDGTPVRTFMYGTDMALWLLTLLAQGKSGSAYNVGSERAVTIAELGDLILRLSAGKGKVVIQGASLQGNAPSYYVPDTAKIRAEFALAETVTLEDGLNATLEWYRRKNAHPGGTVHV